MKEIDFTPEQLEAKLGCEHIDERFTIASYPEYVFYRCKLCKSVRKEEK